MNRIVEYGKTYTLHVPPRAVKVHRLSFTVAGELWPRLTVPYIEYYIHALIGRFGEACVEVWAEWMIISAVIHVNGGNMG